jgi:2-keto-3-deoxy-L-rhamnonate aldolase RhmA
VRVPTSEPHGISIALALGALGVMVPMVDTRMRLRRSSPRRNIRLPGSVDSLSYTSTSTRETSRLHAAANEEVAVVVMIETATGLENVEAIAKSLESMFSGSVTTT